MSSNRASLEEVHLVVEGFQRLPRDMQERVESLIDLLAVSSDSAGVCAASMISQVTSTCRESGESCIEDLDRIIEFLSTSRRTTSQKLD